MRPDPKETIEMYNEYRNIWINALEDVSIKQLQFKPDESSWSLGQVYKHIIEAGNTYMLVKAENCLDDLKNQELSLNENGKKLIETNTFPFVNIKFPGSSAYQPENPESKTQIVSYFNDLDSYMNKVGGRLEKDPPSGKKAHRFFDYMDAYEWYRLVPVHIKHHLNQKAKLEKIFESEKIQ